MGSSSSVAHCSASATRSTARLAPWLNPSRTMLSMAPAYPRPSPALRKVASAANTRELCRSHAHLACGTHGFRHGLHPTRPTWPGRTRPALARRQPTSGLRCGVLFGSCSLNQLRMATSWPSSRGRAYGASTHTTLPTAAAIGSRVASSPLGLASRPPPHTLPHTPRTEQCAAQPQSAIAPGAARRARRTAGGRAGPPPSASRPRECACVSSACV
jgi:hypothetical protein